MKNILDIVKLITIQFPFNWTLTPKFDMGLLSTNHAFLKAKQDRKNPNTIAISTAKDIEEYIKKENLPISVKTIGPYINIDIEKSELYKYTLSSQIKKPKLKQIEESIVIDMFHPNIGKKMHVGHMRSGNLGEVMRRVLSLKYNKVISDNHLGDWGIQFSYTSWGILHLDQLDLDFETIDLDSESRTILIDKFYKIYVRVNKILDDNPEIKQKAQQNSKLLEKGLQNAKSLSEMEKVKFDGLYDLYKKIVNLSLVQFTEAEDYLNLNKNPEWLIQSNDNFGIESIDKVKELVGCHQINNSHINGKFDMILGESFFISFLDEFNYLVEQKLAIKDNQAIYIDLEDRGLGRCYLISSEGYSLYHSRDIINRVIYAGFFELDNAISFADLRQEHSFKQVFAILELIIESKAYNDKSFGWLTKKQTKKAFEILSNKMAMFEGFGHLNLPEGAMSTRKGKIFEFTKLQKNLKDAVAQTLKKKEYNALEKNQEQKIKQLAVATLKWADLHRDREQDVVFDIQQFLKFEGNTGIYQLYTVARLANILNKNGFIASDTIGYDFNKLNEVEINIVKRIYSLPILLESVCNNYKPHIICNYLFELATDVNSWYSKYTVTNETDKERKNALLNFCDITKKHLWSTLELLGIEPVNSL